MTEYQTPPKMSHQPNHTQINRQNPVSRTALYSDTLPPAAAPAAPAAAAAAPGIDPSSLSNKLTVRRKLKF